ncbi:MULTISPECIES: BlaI/MecI/CopY family transcriptional regulator [Nocardiopsis]|uniref:BlaI/MecI/CopY family transcriptional regulator n=1 Tax=Nocardiopsis lambiniae TaxID=3075539 RepID=A0ABU2MF70_9ACTN|nr:MULTISPECIES: BlaI/MecI/CopY family transcriptional regulator [unclassified Nocardiopsis]MDE3720951.1 BlaI/MecI/CopY family transcriptional regulator [Nocardiopsis sp. N85]MDT0331282.1 BlaI/MecI/CopY family transcriptional regulator [Nocardiopsis sp. DSM 44743]
MKGLGELEAAIMDALWRSDEPLPVRLIHETMVYDREIAYTTVMTVAGILFNKGLLDREKRGRAWVYWPRESHAEYTARVMDEILDTGPGPEATLRSFVERFSDEEMAHFHRVLSQVRLNRGVAS